MKLHLDTTGGCGEMEQIFKFDLDQTTLQLFNQYLLVLDGVRAVIQRVF